MSKHHGSASRHELARDARRARSRVAALAGKAAIAFAAFAALPAVAQKLPAGCPPKTRKDNVVDVLHGARVPDPYRWLEAQYSPATRQWIAAEDRCTNGVLNKLPDRADISEELGKLMRTEDVGVPIERNHRFFYMKRAADQDLSLIYMRQGVEGNPELLFDPRPLSKDHSTSATLLGASDDGRYMLYGVRLGGQDQVALHIMDVETRHDLPDKFARRHYFGLGFTRDEKGLYYGTTSATGPRVMFHKMGAPSIRDRVIFGKGYSRQYLITPMVFDDGRWLLIRVSEGTSGNTAIYVEDLLAKKPELKPIVKDISATFQPEIAGDTLYMMTDWKAPDHRIVAVDLAGDVAPAAWRDGVPESANPIEGFSLAGGKLLVRYLVDAAYRLEIFDTNGKREREIPLPEMGTVGGVESRWKSNDVMFSYQSFAITPAIYHYDMETKSLTVLARPKIPVSPADFETKQVWYHSKDGTRVPMFLFYKRGLEPNGEVPTLLTGYGGFDLSSTPGFRPEAIVWAEHGGLYAMANMRGGGEFGEAWHRAGMFGKKQNVFDDFYAAAEWLIHSRYTNPTKLGIQGMSNGGLLMGAALTQRPDLFRAVVCMYPLLDMLRYQKFMGGPWWVSEYGSADNAEQFKYLLKYSPYQNIHPGTEYPAVLFITGDGDTRVAPLHARKMAARLQAGAANGPGRPILLLYDTKSGHSGGRPVGQQIAEQTNMISFLFWQLGVN
ncbi:MAG: S9 family peptidase [Acidobacteriota bacterium]|nr:S9 family peptidase [Acidobacteriota bacterium]